MDLFEYARQNNRGKESPLAARLRPTSLEDVVGQQDIIGKDRLLYRAIMADKLGSVIFYGPPGTGKTTLAQVIAHTTRSEFVQLNATTSGKKDMEEAVRAAQDRMGMYGRKTILFIDEIHRFNKGQQDYLLPFVEDGTVTLIGATTENPYFEVNSALLSRSMIFELKPLSAEDVGILIRRAVTDREKGMGAYDIVMDEDAGDFLADLAGGDARHALNAVELAVLTTQRTTPETDGGRTELDGKIHITLETARECIQKRVARYDKNGDNHYDTVSAFIKSMRGSDPDAAVYYLARMLYAGEEPEFIARRIMICAAEDVGNADPNALVVAVNCSLACERLGMPESQILLAQAAEYVAAAPKSNTAEASVQAAMALVEKTGDLPIPPYLQDAHYSSAEKLGRGIGYEYSHVFRNHYSGQPYLPEKIRGTELYRPSENGQEKKIREHLYDLTGDERYRRQEELAERDRESGGSPHGGGK